MRWGCFVVITTTGRIVCLGIIFFAFSTLITWSYYGDRGVDYLFGSRAVKPYRWIYVGFVVIGSVIKLGTVIDFCDIMNALMAIPNLIALIMLSPTVALITRDYFRRMKSKA